MTVKVDDEAFSEAAFRARAAARLHQDMPEDARDLAAPARRSDDDLNLALGMTTMDPAGTRFAAVLVALVERAHGLNMILTQRTEHLPTHAGQVAFPGGKVDESDAGPVAAALRETHEETGIHPRFVDVVGFLDAYQTRTGFRIVPVVSILRPGFELIPEPGEVAEIFEVPLSFLMNAENHQRHSRVWQGRERFFYAMPYEGHYIWGATAGMIKNLHDRMYGD